MRGIMRSVVRALFSLLAVGLCAPARADALRPEITYSTSVLVGDPSRISGTPVISFQGVDHGTFTTPTVFHSGDTINPVPPGFGVEVPLGQLVITAPPVGTTTTYNSVPFDLMVKTNAVNGDPNAAPPGQIFIEGFLGATISSSGPSTLKLNFMAIGSNSPLIADSDAGGFNVGPLDYHLTLPHDFTISLGPGDITGQRAIAGVFLTGSPVPEPATAALFLALCAGLAGRLYRGRRNGAVARIATQEKAGG